MSISAWALQVVGRVAGVLEVADRAGRERAVGRLHQAGAPLLGDALLSMAVGQRLAAVRLSSGLAAFVPSGSISGPSATLSNDVAGLGEAGRRGHLERVVMEELVDGVGVGRLHGVELAGAQRVRAAVDVDGHDRLDGVEVRQVLTGDAVRTPPVVVVAHGDERVAVAGRVGLEHEGARARQVRPGRRRPAWPPARRRRPGWPPGAAARRAGCPATAATSCSRTAVPEVGGQGDPWLAPAVVMRDRPGPAAVTSPMGDIRASGQRRERGRSRC